MASEQTQALFTQLIAELLTVFQPGELIPHQWLKERLGYKDPEIKEYKSTKLFRKALEDTQFAYITFVESLRTYLLKDQRYYLSSVRRDGYKILLPKEQSGYALKSTIKGITKELNNGSKIVNHIRVDELSDEDKKMATDRQAKISQLEQMFKTARK